jgi:hypothetical protein
MATRRGFLGLFAATAATPVLALDSKLRDASELGTLDAPAPERGYEQCWIRLRLGEELDAENLKGARDRGWSVRLVNGKTMCKGDLVLCHRPVRMRMTNQRAHRFSELTDRCVQCGITRVRAEDIIATTTCPNASVFS